MSAAVLIFFIFMSHVQGSERDYELVTPSRLFASILTAVVTSTANQAHHYITYVYIGQLVKGKNRPVASALEHRQNAARHGGQGSSEDPMLTL